MQSFQVWQVLELSRFYHSLSAILLVLQNEYLICFRMETIIFIVAQYRYFVILTNSGYVNPCLVLGQCFESFTTDIPKVLMVL